MKLFFDARYIRTDHHDGISRFSFELAQRVGKYCRDTTFIIYTDAQKKFLPAGAKTVKLPSPQSPKELWGNGKRLAAHSPDVVFSPLQTLSPFKSYKLILTLHDTIYYRHPTPPAHFPAPIRLAWRVFHKFPALQRKLLNGADAVVTVSEKSKKEIEAMRLTKRPISVIYNAPNDLSQYLKAPVVNDKVENLVYMGSFVPYKNVDTLVRAMKHLPGRTLHLLSRITPAQKKQLLGLVPENGGKLEFYDGVSDKKYAEVLANNACLVSASKDEGFGLPVVEAMSLGVPVVLSDNRAFHEVAGEAALFFNPTCARSLARSITALDDKKLRQKLVTAGKKQASKFDWDTSAEKLIKLAREIYDGQN